MSDQFPSPDDPTRMGPPPQQPPQGSWPAPGQQPGQQPGQPPQGSWPAPGQQPGQQPGQPQQGSWPAPGQQPGNPYDQPGGAVGGWGPPQGPGGPGGPQGPWGPMDQPPSGGGRKGLVIAAIALVLLLIGGGIAAAVALTGGDEDDDAKGSEETSQTDEPTDDLTDEPTDGLSTETESTSTEGFEATNFDEVGRVCAGEAMTNAAEWDPAAPVGQPFFNSPEEPDTFRNMPVGASQGWILKDYGAFETTNFVVCAVGAPSTTVEVQQCKDDDGAYEWQPYDWTVTTRAASTGEVLSELDTYEETQTGCPEWAIVDENRTAHSMVDSRAIEAAISGWLTQAGGDSEGGAAPFEATSYMDLARVCMGGAATNMPTFDPATPKGMGALNTEKEPNYAGNLSIGTLDKWAADFRNWEKANFIVCADGKPSATVKPRSCKASQEKKKGKFEFVQFDYELTVREIATGEVLTELDTLVPELDSCPMFAFVDQDGVYTPSPDSSDIREQINVWLAAEKKRK